MNFVKSKQRVSDHGEIFTPAWMVEAMLGLVKDDTERIDSRFLEPACGNGNFLVQILRRKLAAVELKYGKSDFERQHYALLALMCIYGIELLADNIAECRVKVLGILAEYLNLDESDELYRAASYVVSQNLKHPQTQQRPGRSIRARGLRGPTGQLAGKRTLRSRCAGCRELLRAARRVCQGV